MNEPTLVVLALIAFALAVLFVRERLRSREEARALFERWREGELARVEAELSRSLELRSEAALARFKLEHEARIREDAVRRSQAVFSGKTAEQFVPFLPDFPFDPKDTRFLGSPIDLVVFDGMSRDDLREIVFVEVKTGPSASLSKRERRIRDAVDEGRVRFQELRVGSKTNPPRPASLFVPLRQNSFEPCGQFEIAGNGSEIRYWSDWTEAPLAYPLDSEVLVRIDERRYGLKLRTDGPLPCLVLEDDVRVWVDLERKTLSVQFGDEVTVSYVLETERLIDSPAGMLLVLDDN